MWAKQKGFTIVELLIVIVVIAILAAISVVAYNGIQARSENTKTVQGVAQYVKIFNMYATTYGVYPTSVVPPAAPPANLWTCLPYSTSTCASSSSTPSSCFGLNTTGTNTAFESELKKVASSLPSLSDKGSECSSTQTFQGVIVLIHNSGKSVQIHFPQRGDVSCPSIGGAVYNSRMFSANTTKCHVNMPDLS
jgi:prepilin-type N-terminal cleavage/methylation domain-containing protein